MSVLTNVVMQFGQTIAEKLEPLTDEERLDFFSVLKAKYCIYCGTQTDGRTCHCTNDE